MVCRNGRITFLCRLRPSLQIAAIGVGSRFGGTADVHSGSIAPQAASRLRLEALRPRISRRKRGALFASATFKGTSRPVPTVCRVAPATGMRPPQWNISKQIVFLDLFFAVLFEMGLHRLFSVSPAVNYVASSYVSMVCSLLVTSGLVMLGRFSVMARGVRQMF